MLQNELAEALGVDVRTVRRWVDEGMQSVGEGRTAVYDEPACRAWCERRGKKIRPRGAASSPSPPPPTAPPSALDAPPVLRLLPPDGSEATSRERLEAQPHGGALKRSDQPPPRDPVARAAEIAALRNAAASPIERARAVLVAASSALADAIESAEGATGRDFDSFRGSLDGLRQAEAAYLELERERGELIDRTAARGAIGRLARLLVIALERLEARAAAQVELWLADAELRALPVEERERAVRAWVRAQTKQGRVETTAELDALIAAEIAAEGKAQ